MPYRKQFELDRACCKAFFIADFQRGFSKARYSLPTYLLTRLARQA